MSNDAMTKFDPSTLADKVRERIRGAIADLIPEDAWKAMVEREIKSFCESPGRDPYGKVVLSGMAKAVNAEMDKLVTAQVKAMLASPEWAARWDAIVSPAVAKIVVEKAPEIVASILGNTIQNVIGNMQHQFGR